MSSILVSNSLFSILHRPCEYCKFKSSIGLTKVNTMSNIFDDEVYSTNSANHLFQDLIKDLDLEDIITYIDFDESLVGDTRAENPKGESAEMLSKTWKRYVNTAEHTLDVTTQRLCRYDDPNLSPNYSTNGRMLYCKRINKWFFMNNFYTTSKTGKSTLGITCV